MAEVPYVERVGAAICEAIQPFFLVLGCTLYLHSDLVFRILVDSDNLRKTCDDGRALQVTHRSNIITDFKIAGTPAQASQIFRLFPLVFR